MAFLTTDRGYVIGLDEGGLHITSDDGKPEFIANFDEYETIHQFLQKQYFEIERSQRKGVTRATTGTGGCPTSEG